VKLADLRLRILDGSITSVADHVLRDLLDEETNAPKSAFARDFERLAFAAEGKDPPERDPEAWLRALGLFRGYDYRRRVFLVGPAIRPEFRVRSNIGDYEYVADDHEVARRQDEENRMAREERERR
jgi:hypothetical protein